MSKNYRLRRLLAPARGFRKALVVVVLGVVISLVGAGLSFKPLILPLLEQFGNFSSRALMLVVPPDSLEEARHLLGGIFLLLGLYLIFSGVRAAIRHVFNTLNPEMKGGVVDRYRKRQQLAHGPNIVALGGGTGLGTLLRGLKQHSSNITAIVTVTDDGGSSGRLSQEKGIIPPGDIRNCLVALADAEKSMTDLFQHRFTRESGSLSGHAMGNLLIAALVDQAHGDFEKAIEIASDVLAIRGRVVPSTLSNVRLRAVMEDGIEICGETAIVESGRRIRRIFLEPASCEPHRSALEAIAEADLICIGPGSVYTSVIPNLLVPGIAEALAASDAKKAYICNVMTQRGESDSFTASEHVTALQASIDERFFDYVLLNTGTPSAGAIEKYREAGQFLVEADIDRVRAMGYKVIAGDFMNESDLVRHDPMKVAARLLALVNKR
jgi:uncharacterized cofD-like protein